MDNTPTLFIYCHVGDKMDFKYPEIYFIILPCDPTVVICYLIWPCDIAVRTTYFISHSSSLSYNTVIKGYFRLGV